MSYLNVPRLTFAGSFQADPSTVNNDVNHYDNATFEPIYQEPQTPDSPNGWWNPDGTGNWRLIDCFVTSVTYLDGTVTRDHAEDPVIGMRIMDANARVAAKIVDLDPEQQCASEVWGMMVRILNGTEPLFKSDFKPVAFNNIWWIRSLTQKYDAGASATYQSVLQNIEWADNLPSRFLTELKAAGGDELSIKFNVDIHNSTMHSAGFTIGRIVGSIGPHRPNGPRHFTMGRQLFPAVLSYVSQIPGYLPYAGTPPGKGNLYFATALVDEELGCVVVDLGNSLLTTGANGAIAETRPLMLAAVTREGDFDKILATLNYEKPTWYHDTAGLATAYLTPEQLDIALKYPLQIITPNDTGAAGYEILLAEQPYYVRADSFVARLNPGDSVDFDFYASYLGKPMVNQLINHRQQTEMFAFGQTMVPNLPVLGTPASAISFNATSITNQNGFSTIRVTAGDPGLPRVIIDGQLYAIWTEIDGQPVETFTPIPLTLSGVNPNDYISILLHGSVDPEIVKAANWQNVQPILQQYANLYPIMSKGLFNLADQEQVNKNAALLKFAFTRPMNDPNYMPPTRDLSRDNQQMILNYLDNIIAAANLA